ncbi:MAG: tRNA 2-thiouridine(34) synthase MnmA [Rhodospirillaceae bacterium]|nr:tRNA 2-thiouridine(34) synthase MnmA [Rhodospirillaceae bacterium]|tara:strand:- start:755 stop:1888 length:1134 start_codon:yes stop_codon:yes gene_type:complete
MEKLVTHKKPADTKVVVAMSGGVDSSVTAALLVEAGYDVVGITLQLYDHGAAVTKKGACCAGQDIYDARNVADQLGFPHYVLDYESRFRDSVIEEFADSYLAGETPVPCIRCNQTVKFRDLLLTAKDLNADALATGHYIKRIEGETGPELHRAEDASRDQSYFLFATTTEQLEFLRFPLGSLPKSDTRAHAIRFDLPVAEKPDSQDICFVPNGSYANIVEKLRPGAIEAGDIVDLEGNVIGHHEGIIRFTIGQRRGLGIGGRDENSEPLYVIRLEPSLKRVVVGPREALAVNAISLKEVNWLGEESEASLNSGISVKYRSMMEPVPAIICLEAAGNAAQVSFDKPQYGISSGQACVFYKGERVMGGGWIGGNQRFVD